MNEIEVKTKVKPRTGRYKQLWDQVVSRAEKGNLGGITIKIPGLTDEMFSTIRKAVWNEKDLDLANRDKWRIQVKRDGDRIKFSVVPKQMVDRI